MLSKQLSTVSEIELHYKSRISNHPKITQSADAYSVLKECYHDDLIELREEFIILLLNRANTVLGRVCISTGTTVGTLVDVKHILASACKSNSSAVILSHNHPSGNLKPSQADLKITQRIKEALGLVDVSLLDHIIMTKDDYTSLADQGSL